MASKNSRTPGVADGKTIVGLPTDDDVSAEDRVKALFGSPLSADVYDGWAADIFSTQLSLLSATSHPHGSTIFSFTVLPSQCNRLGNLHGGCTASLFDGCTTSALAPIAKPGYWAYAGVTRTLNVTYLRPVPVGMEVLIESTVVSASKRLAVIKGEMRERSSGVLLAICEHGKVSIDPEVARL